jgi:hypothetical protein
MALIAAAGFPGERACRPAKHKVDCCDQNRTMQIEKTTLFDAQRTPVISVIIATYNRAGMLRETLDSIVTQTSEISKLLW